MIYSFFYKFQDFFYIYLKIIIIINNNVDGYLIKQVIRILNIDERYLIYIYIYIIEF